MQTQEPLLEPLHRSTAPPAKRRRTRSAAGIALVVALLLAIGFIPKLLRNSEAKEMALRTSDQLPVVFSVRARAAAPTAELELPGNVEAVYVSSLYARASGYVKRRLVDIGQQVHAGQLLAEIEAPEVDQQLERARAAVSQARAAYAQSNASLLEARAGVGQARAQLQQASANEEIAKTTDTRWTRLVERGVIPRQQGDEKRSAYQARAAEVAAAQANVQTAEATVVARQANIDASHADIAAAQADVRRLEQMVAFERVLAPFDGVITERNVERGDLVTAAGGTGQSRLFSIAQADVLRIQTQVPQAYASDVQIGQTVQVEVKGSAAKSVLGKVARSANALNQQSRTLLTEVQIDNRGGLLFPGMFAEVKFSLPRRRQLVLIPADTLLVNNDGQRVALAGKDGKVHYRHIEIGRDLGGEIEVVNGLEGNESLISNPSDSLTEGQAVEVRVLPAAGKTKS